MLRSAQQSVLKWLFVIPAITMINVFHVRALKAGFVPKDLVGQKLLNDHCSVVRWGDGEAKLICGLDTRFQRADVRLAFLLVKAIFNRSDRLLIGDPTAYSGGELAGFLRERHGRIWLLPRAISIIKRYLSRGRTSIDAFGFRPEGAHDYTGFLWQLLSRRKHILVIGPFSIESVCNYLQPFVSASKISAYSVPPENAYNAIDAISQTIEEFKSRVDTQDSLVLLSCGPVAKVLVVKYAQTLQLIDVGHFFRDIEKKRLCDMSRRNHQSSPASEYLK